MALTDATWADAVAQAALVRAGDATPVELVDAAIARVEAVNPRLNAVIHPLFERARVAAAAVDRSAPFAGVPIVVKDLDGELAGAPCHFGTKYLRRIGYVSERSSWMFEKLEAAGFVVVGKTNCPEWGLVPTTEPEAHGPTRNPWDVARSPGGSSGGSAAAVASGMVAVGHAGDGGGSIRIPASECGLVGLKPSRGRVSMGPDVAEGWGGAVVWGAVTRTVRDTAAVLDVVSGPMPGDPYAAPPPIRPFAAEVGADPGRLRVGVRTEAFAGLGSPDPACAAAVESVAALLGELGHDVDDGSPTGLDDPALTEAFLPCFATWVASDLATLEQMGGEPVRDDDVEPGTWALAELGRSVPAVRFVEGLDALRAIGRDVCAWWADGHDLLLTPTVVEPPPLLGRFEDGGFEAMRFVAYTIPFNVSGQPAVSLPLHWTADGLPVGVQLVAAPWREDLLLRVAAQLEAARPWADRRPPVHA